MSSIIEAMAAAGTPPCETCRHYEACSKGRLACYDFATVVEWGEHVRPACVSVQRQIEQATKRSIHAATHNKRKAAEHELRKLEYWHRRLVDYGTMERFPDRQTFLGVMVGFNQGKGRTLEEWETDRINTVVIG